MSSESNPSPLSPGERSAIEEAHEDCIKKLFEVGVMNSRQIGEDFAVHEFTIGLAKVRSLRDALLGNAAEKNNG
jgi:hypothetical protein